MKTKNFLLLILMLCLVLSVAFASNNLFSEAKAQKTDKQTEVSDLPEDSQEFCGVVEKAEENRFLINTDNGGPLYITITDDTEIFKGDKTASVTDIKEGANLKVAHNGIVLKSYPGQINIVYRVTILEAN